MAIDQPHTLMLSYNELIAIIALLIAFIGGIISKWIDLSSRIRTVEVTQKNMATELKIYVDMMEKHRTEQIEREVHNREENRLEHNSIIAKIEKMFDKYYPPAPEDVRKKQRQRVKQNQNEINSK